MKDDRPTGGALAIPFIAITSIIKRWFCQLASRRPEKLRLVADFLCTISSLPVVDEEELGGPLFASVSRRQILAKFFANGKNPRILPQENGVFICRHAGRSLATSFDTPKSEESRKGLLLQKETAPRRKSGSISCIDDSGPRHGPNRTENLEKQEDYIVSRGWDAMPREQKTF